VARRLRTSSSQVSVDQTLTEKDRRQTRLGHGGSPPSCRVSVRRDGRGNLATLQQDSREGSASVLFRHLPQAIPAREELSLPRDIPRVSPLASVNSDDSLPPLRGWTRPNSRCPALDGEFLQVRTHINVIRTVAAARLVHAVQQGLNV